MKKEKFTPGPWRIELEDDDLMIFAHPWEYDIFIGCISKVAIPLNPKRDGQEGTSEANARLIAAAPELLERLTDIISFVKKDLKERNIPFCFTGAEDAIKKALGE